MRRRDASRRKRRPLRVGFLCDVFELGGQEQGCLEVLRRLDRRRFKPYLYTFRAGKLLREVERLRIPIFLGSRKRPSDQSWTAADTIRRKQYNRQLTAKLRKDRIDVCIVYAWIEGAAVAHQAGIRAVVERVDGFELISRVRDKSPYHRIICESHTIRNILLAQRELLRCRARQLVVIPNGIDLRRFNPARYNRNQCRKALRLGPEEFVIGSVSRLAPQKNLEHLLRAAKLLIQRAPRAARIRIIIAGPDGGSRKALMALARRLRIAKNVRFLGARTDIPQVLRALDVFTMPSFHEGTPFAMLEAMAMGLPIVASQVGSIPEIIDGNGYLICVLSPAETHNALLELLASPSLRTRLGHRSLKLARRYNVDEMIKQYESALVDAVKVSRKR